MGDSVSAEEFERWIPFPTAFERVAKGIGRSEAMEEIRHRLLLGSIRGMAREAHIENYTQPRVARRFVIISQALLMRGGSIKDHSSIWKTGSHTFTEIDRGRPTTTFCEGVRLEPSGVDQILIDAGLLQPTPAPVSAPEPISSPDRKPLPAIEHENISRALVAVWGNALTEERAWELAKGMFPDHSIPRDTFLRTFRVIRGPKNRGKQPLND